MTNSWPKTSSGLVSRTHYGYGEPPPLHAASTAEIEHLWTCVRIDAERIDSLWPALISPFNVKLNHWDGLWQYLAAVTDAFRREADSINRVLLVWTFFDVAFSKGFPCR